MVNQKSWVIDTEWDTTVIKQKASITGYAPQSKKWWIIIVTMKLITRKISLYSKINSEWSLIIYLFVYPYQNLKIKLLYEKI